ncbi:TetR/AcrR family transcriptional regulator [Nonomuraea sp. NBC_01738]|uniref:TetR/AcrR family transcriptional regulator n=1 Tax=Nonomuraea sp. NBC_01738 TaxID=2976003 RepID=UPI002E139409|nr:TetR/AcrR family transcriptional regulator [Nonomuraea sp. NBC_01738]
MMTTPETRTRILSAAQRLFAERGYAGTSLADIAAEVGLTKTAVAYHFHPKTSLASELVAPAADEMFALLGSGLAGDALIAPLIGFAARHRAVIRLLLEDLGTADEAPPGSPGEAIRTFRDEIHAKLAGPGTAGRVRGWAILGALQYGVVQTMDLAEEEVIDALRATLLP